MQSRSPSSIVHTLGIAVSDQSYKLVTGVWTVLTIEELEWTDGMSEHLRQKMRSKKQSEVHMVKFMEIAQPSGVMNKIRAHAGVSNFQIQYSSYITVGSPRGLDVR